MPLLFRNVVLTAPGCRLEADFSIVDGVIAGVTGPNGAGKGALLELAAGGARPESGEVRYEGEIRLLEPTLFSSDVEAIRGAVDSLPDGKALVLAGPSLALTDPAFLARAFAKFNRIRAHGGIVLIVSQDLQMLERRCDEVIVVERGKIVGQGEPKSVLRAYRSRLIEAERGETSAPKLEPASKHGDGRAEITRLEMLDSEGRPAGLVSSREQVTLSVGVRYIEAVDDPVVGILIRSRVGIAVYGTNTELENVRFGPCVPGQKVELRFSFRCDLCPEEYTVTVASHDHDGTAHEWLDDAIRFTVADTRYTAGVANLQAKVELAGEND